MATHCHQACLASHRLELGCLALQHCLEHKSAWVAVADSSVLVAVVLADIVAWAGTLVELAWEHIEASSVEVVACTGALVVVVCTEA